MSAPRQALIVGGTGATGSHLLSILVSRGWRVRAFARREVATEGVETVVVDGPDFVAGLDKTTTEQWKGDVLFNCLGTTRALAGSAEKFVHIEHTMSAKAADKAREAGVPQIAIVSAGSANSSVPAVSWFHPMLYAHTLGEKENTAHGFTRASIFRPGMLDRLQPRDEGFLIKLVSHLPISRLRVDVLALAMVLDAEKRMDAQDKNGIKKYTGNDVISAMSKTS